MQPSFSELEYAVKKKVTRRDRFLAEIEAIALWAEQSTETLFVQRFPKGTSWLFLVLFPAPLFPPRLSSPKLFHLFQNR